MLRAKKKKNKSYQEETTVYGKPSNQTSSTEIGSTAPYRVRMDKVSRGSTDNPVDRLFIDFDNNDFFDSMSLVFLGGYFLLYVVGSCVAYYLND
jgi:hypothetical protein